MAKHRVLLNELNYQQKAVKNTALFNFSRWAADFEDQLASRGFVPDRENMSKLRERTMGSWVEEEPNSPGTARLISGRFNRVNFLLRDVKGLIWKVIVKFEAADGDINRVDISMHQKKISWKKGAETLSESVLVVEEDEISKISPLKVFKSPSKDQRASMAGLPESDKFTEDEKKAVEELIKQIDTHVDAVNELIKQANAITAGPVRDAFSAFRAEVARMERSKSKITLETVQVAFLQKPARATISAKDLVEALKASLEEHTMKIVLQLESDLQTTAKAKYDGIEELYVDKLVSEGVISSIVGFWRKFKDKSRKILAALRLVKKAPDQVKEDVADAVKHSYMMTAYDTEAVNGILDWLAGDLREMPNYVKI